MTESKRTGSEDWSSEETMVDSSGTGRAPSSGALDGGRFAPGTLLDARYRIVGLQGRGGMGEVYRADDLTLGEPVAIKMLPSELVTDEAALSRFHEEVRLARRITHPNVVRVHDIGEIDGVPYLTMEFVAGEDLAGLLRRIGRLPEDKAVELARQLCAGLAEAHESGVLHRDLKPANVMIDLGGRAKISDFGLARLAGDLREHEILAGTPAYMAPEQLAGTELSEQTDLFALGLVLYEMFTGKSALGDEEPAQLLATRSRGPVAQPTAHVDSLSSEVESVILRCLEQEAAERPSSALEVSAALPGGDPLALAVAAGETPSPEMVAAAPREGRIPKVLGGGLLALLAILIVATLWLRQDVMLTSIANLPRSDAVLEDRALTLLAELGYGDPSEDAESGWSMNTDYLKHLWRDGARPDEVAALTGNRPAPLWFTYRQSPEPLRVRRFGQWEVPLADPLFVAPGTAEVVLDPEGRLLRLRVEPSRRGEQGANVEALTAQLFAAAGLALEEFTPAAPRVDSAIPADQRLAWEGSPASWAGARLHVSADLVDGRAVRFEVVPPWRSEKTGEAGLRAPQVFYIVLWLSALTVGVALARRHVKEGRADLSGANRLAVFMVLSSLAGWFFGVPDLRDLSSLQSFLEALATALLGGAFFWVVYAAFEPFLRKRWPDGVVSWTRLLAGRFRDPLVGRDVLIGAVVATAAAALVMAHGEAIRRLGGVAVGADPFWGLSLTGLRSVLASTLSFTAWRAVFTALGGVFIFVLCFALLRRRWLATLAYLLLSTLFITGVASIGIMPGSPPTLPILIGGIMTLVTARYGALSLVVYWFVFFLLIYLPTTLDLSAWHALGTLAAAVATLSLGAWGWWSATADPPRPAH